MRGCYDGMSTYLGDHAGDVRGCLQYWYSGDWTPGGGDYAASVSSHLDARGMAILAGLIAHARSSGIAYLRDQRP